MIKTHSFQLGVICMALFLGLCSCIKERNNTIESSKPINYNSMKEAAEIYLAGGCFWGEEHFLKQINGILETQVGYANGNTINPTYQEVCSGKTGHAETVRVAYDPNTISLEKILELYFMTIDPTLKNRQGNDIGTQYRTGIYYTRPEDKEIAQRALEQLQTHYKEPVVVELLPLDNFSNAEEYHQDYLDKNPNGYCHISPELINWIRQQQKESPYQKPSPLELKEKLTPIQYAVTQENGTEPPFQNSYWNETRPGIYVDITTGEPLFVSTDKFQSDCGWPSFSRPIDKSKLVRLRDTTHNMERVEVRSKLGDAHLGHLFPDGPKESGGLRYCINSAALKFIPKQEMEQQGYADYLYLVK